MLARPGVTVYDVQSHLLSENKKHGHRRCTAPMHLDGDGVPTLGYCGRWPCWKCADTRLWLERRRMLLGASQLFDTSGLWFVTVTRKSTYRKFDTAAWRKNTDELIKRWHKKAVRAGVELVYCHVTGFKPSNGEIHAHMLVNWCPSPVSSPTPNYPHHHRDTWLEPKAAELGLTLWIELAQSPDAVGKYTARNLESVAGVEFPAHFQRVKYSRSWPKLPPKEKPDALIEFGEWLGASVTVSDNIVPEKKEPVWTCGNCGQQIFSDRDGLPFVCDYCGDATTWTPLDGDTDPISYTHKVRDIPDTDTAPAQHLDADNLDAVQLALELAARGMHPDAATLPVSAVTDLANKTARCNAPHRADFQTSEHNEFSDGLYHAFRRRTQTTPCQRRKRMRQHCRREKPP